MGSLLAAKLSPQVRIHNMPKIRIAGQPPIANPDQVLDTFLDFYSDLYNSSHKKLLEAAFKVQDFKKGAAPGPDGLSIPYYKAFVGTLAPQLT